MVKKIGVISLSIIFALTILSSRTLAQSSAALESRISRVESDNFQLRSQIANLESQVATIKGQSSPQTPIIRPQAPSIPPRNRQVTSSDPMFDRLATLVIELKQRVQALEAQVSKLQQRR